MVIQFMTCVLRLSFFLSMIGFICSFRFQSQQVVRLFSLPNRAAEGVKLPFSSVSSNVANNELNEFDYRKDTKNINSATETPLLKRGQSVKFKIVQFGPLGASVQLDNALKGLILQKELALFRNRRNGSEVLVGESLEGFVERVREDGKVDVSLRPVDRTRVELAKMDVLEALQNSDNGILNIGDKSSPQEIAEYFKGLSKSDFKHAVGSLYKDGLIVPGRLSIKLVPKALLPQTQSAAAAAQAESRKRRDILLGTAGTAVAGAGAGLASTGFIERDNECSIFLGNLPPTIDAKGLVTAIQAVILPANIVRIRLCKDQHGIPRGFGYLELAHKNLVEQALVVLKGHEVKGRKLRVDYADREKRFRTAAMKERRERADSAGVWSSDEEEGGDELYGAAGDRRMKKGPVGLPSPATSSEQSLGMTRSANSRYSSTMEAYKRRGGSAADWGEDDRWLGKAAPSSKPRLDPRRPLPQATLFIGNLSFEVTEDQLREAVQGCVTADEIAAVRVILDRETKESRGYGFVDVYTNKAAEKIYNELHDQELMGRKLKVDDATR